MTGVGLVLLWCVLLVLVLVGAILARGGDPHDLYVAGKLDEALTAANGLLQPTTTAGYRGNLRVCLLVAAGRYTEALAWARRTLTAKHPDALLLTNGAEAAYNLGRWDEAEALLAAAARLPMEPMTQTGLALQRAWMVAHWGDGDAALRLVDGADVDALPRPYRAEWHFTRAVALWVRGELTPALAEVERGATAAVRASSHRNALALRGRVERAAGRLAEAEQQLRLAADHRWRGQGGEGLLALALLLRDQQRDAEARVFLERVVTQDPESEAAQQAAALLGVPAPPSHGAFFRTASSAAAAQ